jgi:hypothetical protein
MTLLKYRVSRGQQYLGDYVGCARNGGKCLARVESVLRMGMTGVVVIFIARNGGVSPYNRGT